MKGAVLRHTLSRCDGEDAIGATENEGLKNDGPNSGAGKGTGEAKSLPRRDNVTVSRPVLSFLHLSNWSRHFPRVFVSARPLVGERLRGG